MKSLKNIFIIILCIACLSSCEDFFDNSTPSAIPPEVAYGNAEDIAKTIAGIYPLLNHNNNIYTNRLACGYQGMNTDIEFNTKTGSDETEITRYNIKTTNSSLSKTNANEDPWSCLNDVINQCNEALFNIDIYVADEDGNIENDTIRYYYGELLTLRAFTYLELIKFWGDVPVHFLPIDTSNDDDIYAPKQDRNIIYEQLRIDLKKSADMLGWSEEIPLAANNNKITRMNKAFALGLLARMDLMYAGYALRPDVWTGSKGAPNSVQLNVKDAALRAELYQEALNACGEIIEHYGDSKLSESFEQVFKDICADKTSFSDTEWIWVMEFQNNSRGRFLNYNGVKSKDAANVLKNQVTIKGNNVQAIVPTLVYDFEANDARKWVTIAPFTWAVDNADGVAKDADKREIVFLGCPATEKRLYQKNADIKGFYLGKYRTEWMTRSFIGGSNGDDGIDYPIMRYADILLMYAEASIGGISGDVPAITSYNGIGGQAMFDKVRARAGLEPKTLNMDNIISERAFEFCGEYIRKYDLMRWGKLKTKLITTISRIADLDAHTGEYENTSDSIYFKYRRADEYLETGAEITKAYVLDGIYGLAKGETGAPEGYGEEGSTWVKKNPFASESAGRRLKGYTLYVDEELIDKRHYWPIFQNNVSGSKGSLWNDLWD